MGLIDNLQALVNQGGHFSEADKCSKVESTITQNQHYVNELTNDTKLSFINKLNNSTLPNDIKECCVNAYNQVHPNLNDKININTEVNLIQQPINILPFLTKYDYSKSSSTLDKNGKLNALLSESHINLETIDRQTLISNMQRIPNGGIKNDIIKRFNSYKPQQTITQSDVDCKFNCFGITNTVASPFYALGTFLGISGGKSRRRDQRRNTRKKKRSRFAKRTRTRY